MTVSIHRLSYLFLDALADAKPVWARMVGINKGSMLIKGRRELEAARRTIARLRADVQRSTGGDANERSLLLGMIDEALTEVPCDPSSWLETIATGYELLDDTSETQAFLNEIPAYLNDALESSGRIDRRVLARAEVRAADLSRWFRSEGEADAALAVDRSVKRWPERCADVPPLGLPAWERLFRAVHRLGFSASELHAIAVGAMAKSHAEVRTSISSADELARSVESARARWVPNLEMPPLLVRESSPERPLWLSPYRPLRPLDASHPAVLHPCAGTVSSIAQRYAYPGEHALRSGTMRRHHSDLRRVTAAPATIAGWRSFAAFLETGSHPDAEDAALAAADSGIHSGLWETEEAIQRIAEACPIPMERARRIVAAATARPAYASSAFVGFQEFFALWDVRQATKEEFVTAALGCGPLPIPIAVQMMAKTLVPE